MFEGLIEKEEDDRGTVGCTFVAMRGCLEMSRRCQ